MAAYPSKLNASPLPTLQRAFSSIGTPSRYWKKLTGFTVATAYLVAEVPPRKPWHLLAAAGLPCQQPVFLLYENRSGRS